MKSKQVNVKAFRRQLKPYINVPYFIQLPGHPIHYVLLKGFEGDKVKIDVLDRHQNKIQQVSFNGFSSFVGGPSGDISAGVKSFLFGVFVIIAISFWFGFCSWRTFF